MSMSSLFSIARSALVTQQKALDVAGHNIANASTPGYTRQVLDVHSAVPFNTPYGTVGRGVTSAGVFASRDSFLDASYRTEQGSLGNASTMSTLLQRVQGTFGEPSDTGLGATLDSFINSWSDLANDPSSASARVAVQQAGQALVSQVRSISGQLDAVGADAATQLNSTVGNVNTIANQIADLNRQIVALGGPLHTAPDLEDQRGQLLDKLSNLMNVRVISHGDGSVGVIAGDTMLVDGNFAQQLEVRGVSGGGYGLGLVGSSSTVDPVSGQLAALADLTTTQLPGVRASLDQLVSGLVGAVNALHQTGTTPGGATNTDFFDPAGVTAHTFALAAPIAASANNIAAGATANSGDGSVALQLAALRSAPQASVGGVSFSTYYSTMMANLGTAASNADGAATAADTLVSNTSAQRSSASGVSIDEEMVSLITHQQAYAAAARVVNVASQVLDDLIKMVS